MRGLFALALRAHADAGHPATADLAPQQDPKFRRLLQTVWPASEETYSAAVSSNGLQHAFEVIDRDLAATERDEELGVEYINALASGDDRSEGLSEMVKLLVALGVDSHEAELCRSSYEREVLARYPEFEWPEHARLKLFYSAFATLAQRWAARSESLRLLADESGLISLSLSYFLLCSRPFTLVGDPGVGKELISQAICELTGRGAAPHFLNFRGLNPQEQKGALENLSSALAPNARRADRW